MSATSVGRLRRFAGQTDDHTTCDLCREPLPNQHSHLLEIDDRAILCACDPCALLFSDGNHGRFRPIPQAVTRVGFRPGEDDWDRLGVPIGLAFFTLREDAESNTVVQVGYPSPAGPVMSSVEVEVWQSICQADAVIGRMRPEIESWLVHRTLNRSRSFVVPIDRCFELIGIIRRQWQGWSGGPEVHQQIDRFFGRLESCAEPGVPS